MRRIILTICAFALCGWAFAAPQNSVERRKPLTAKVGIVGVGLDTYWKQFDGLRDVMLKKLDTFEAKVKANGVETVSFGLVDNAESARKALDEMKRANLDLLFVDMVTYATSATFAAVAREMSVPIVLVALQPESAMPYEKATTFIQLCNDDLCAVPEFADVAIRMGNPVDDIIIGMRQGDKLADAEIANGAPSQKSCTTCATRG